MADSQTQRRVWHASLQTRVTALVVAVVTCIVVGKSAFDLYSSAREREAAMAYHLHMVTDMQAKALANPLWDYNVEQVTAILAGLTREKSFIHASVAGTNGKTVAENPTGSGPADTSGNVWSMEAPSVHEEGIKARHRGHATCHLFPPSAG